MMGLEKMLSAMIGIPPDELKAKMETLERAVIGGLGEIAETAKKVDEMHAILTADKSEGIGDEYGRIEGDISGNSGDGTGRANSGNPRRKRLAIGDGRNGGNGDGSGG